MHPVFSSLLLTSLYANAVSALLKRRFRKIKRRKNFLERRLGKFFLPFIFAVFYLIVKLMGKYGS